MNSPRCSSPARWTPRPARRTLRSTDGHQKHHRRFRRIPPLGTTPSRLAAQGPPRPPDPPHGQRPLSHPRPSSSRWPGTLPCPKPVPKGRQGQCQRRNQNPGSPADATRQLPARIRYRRHGETGFPVGQRQRIRWVKASGIRTQPRWPEKMWLDRHPLPIRDITYETGARAHILSVGGLGPSHGHILIWCLARHGYTTWRKAIHASRSSSEAG